MRSWVVCVPVVAALLSGPAAPAAAQPESIVRSWNAQLVAALVETPTAPPLSGRVAALVQGAVFDAVNGVSRTYPPLHVTPAAPAGASARAAAVEAAHATLSALFPARAATLDAHRARTLGATQDGSRAVADGRAWGQEVAERHLAWRSGDVAGGSCTDGTAPGAWRRTSDNPTQPCAFPSLGTTAPFVVADLDRFAPPPPPALSSRRYASDLAEVVGHAVRADDAAEEATARFWRPNSVVSWNAATQQLAPRGRLVDEAHAYAVVNAAMADATRAAWRAKYTASLWRPITANEQAADDGNPATEPVSGFRTVFPTPNHPDHPSGHATVSGAATRALAALVGDVPLTLTQAGETRSWPSLSAAADEVDDSRVFAGIHFRSAVEDGHRLGDQVADAVVARLARH